MKFNITQVLEFIGASGLVAAVSWFFTKRHFQKVDLKKAEVEVEGSVTVNISQNLSIYQTMLKDLEERLKKKDQEIKDLESEVERFKASQVEVKEKDDKISFLESQIIALKARVRKIEESIQALRFRI